MTEGGENSFCPPSQFTGRHTVTRAHDTLLIPMKRFLENTVDMGVTRPWNDFLLHSVGSRGDTL